MLFFSFDGVRGLKTPDHYQDSNSQTTLSVANDARFAATIAFRSWIVARRPAPGWHSEVALGKAGASRCGPPGRHSVMSSGTAEASGRPGRHLHASHHASTGRHFTSSTATIRAAIPNLPARKAAKATIA